MTRQVVQLQTAGRWPEDVELWHVAMPPPDAGLDTSALHPSELEQASRYRQSADRLRYTVARAALRELLGRRQGIEQAALRFSVTSHGRPELAGTAGNGRLSFNVSHSGQHVLIAISDRRTVGIDVERIDPILDWQALVDLVCTEDEQRVLREESAWLQRQSFFRCWTAKEALLKALGLGITGGLRALTVTPAGDGVRRPLVTGNGLFADAADLQYHWLTDIPGYMGCVAFSGPWEAQRLSAEIVRVCGMHG